MTSNGNTISAPSGTDYLPLILVGIGLLRLINLGFLDMQAWDEGLYAVRTLGAVEHGAWLDQSTAAIGGLYSSLHPPLHIWLSALSVTIFGNSEFSHRLVPVLLGACTLPVIYALGRRLGETPAESRGIGLVAALLFGLNPFVDFYARQGQFDTTLVFFMALGVLLLLRGIDEDRFGWSAAAGVAIGCGLMSKLFVAGGIPLAVAIWILFLRSERRRRIWIHFAILSGVAILVALPWHAMMVVRHGDGDPLFLLRASETFDRFVTGIEGNQKSLEIFYYINQLLVLFPLGVAWSIYGLGQTLRRREPAALLLALWFLLYFAVFTLMRTKLEVYLLPMLLPLSILGAVEIVRAMRGEVSRRTLGILLGVTAAAVAWSLQQEWRTSIKGVLASLMGKSVVGSTSGGWLLIGLCAGGLLLGFYVWRRGLPASLRARLAVVMFVPAFGLGLYNVSVADCKRYLDGGEAVATFVTNGGYRRLVAVGYETNPQLTWYLGGADIGWRRDMSLERIDPTGHGDSLLAWLDGRLGTLPPDAVVLVERDRLVRGEKFTSAQVLPAGWTLLYETRRYTVMRRASIVRSTSSHTPERRPSPSRLRFPLSSPAFRT